MKDTKIYYRSISPCWDVSLSSEPACFFLLPHWKNLMWKHTSKHFIGLVCICSTKYTYIKYLHFTATHIQFYYSCTVPVITPKTGKRANIYSVCVCMFDPWFSNCGPSPGSRLGPRQVKGGVYVTADFTLTLLLCLPFGLPSATCGEEDE